MEKLGSQTFCSPQRKTLSHSQRKIYSDNKKGRKELRQKRGVVNQIHPEKDNVIWSARL